MCMCDDGNMCFKQQSNLLCKIWALEVGGGANGDMDKNSLSKVPYLESQTPICHKATMIMIKGVVFSC